MLFTHHPTPFVIQFYITDLCTHFQWQNPFPLAAALYRKGKFRISLCFLPPWADNS